MQPDSYGDAFGRRFGAAAAPAFVTRTLLKSDVAVTYLRQETPTQELSERQPVEDAYLISLGMGDFPDYRLWENGRPVPTEPVSGGQITFYDFKASPAILVNSPMIGVHYYFPRAAFDAIADNACVPRISGLKYPRGHGVDDPVIRNLSMALLPTFERPEEANRLFVDYVTLAAGAHVAHTYGEMRVSAPKPGCLARWQEERALGILDANLSGNVSLAWLAQQCGLSTSHFTRAFRRSFGVAPHQWLMKRRVERAKDALRDHRVNLTTVALDCGFADQSHFTRVFTKFAGISPGAWRRCLLE